MFKDIPFFLAFSVETHLVLLLMSLSEDSNIFLASGCKTPQKRLLAMGPLLYNSLK
jgi:hypothetical protein